MMRDFQSYAGPGDPGLHRSEIEGYQPVSRIGEVVMNAFIDSYEFAGLADQLSSKDMSGFDEGGGSINEYKPMFHEWATALPGMIALSRKKKTAVFRQYVAAETAAPVIACAACLPKSSENDYFFAGIVRSKSVRSPDDGVGPTSDEFFTLSIGGMATILNNSGSPIHPGDLVEWTLFAQKKKDGTGTAKRFKNNPRRVGVKVASASSGRIIGRALSFSKSGETMDILIKQ